MGEGPAGFILFRGEGEATGITVRIVTIPAEALVQIQSGIHLFTIEVPAFPLEQDLTARLALETVHFEVSASFEVAIGGKADTSEAKGTDDSDGSKGLHVD